MTIQKNSNKATTKHLEDKDSKEEIRAKKLAALNKIKGLLSGKIGDVDVKQIRTDRAIRRAK